MDATLLTFIIISVPGLLSATCSSPAYNAPTPNSGYAKSSMDNRFDVRQNDGNGMGLGMSWAEDYASTSQRSSSLVDQQTEQRCENGWCTEDGSCSCNPCWGGPTCQEYVDRFSPRFLAEEPFFIVDSSSAVTILPFQSVPSIDSTEGLYPFVDAVQTSSSFSSPLSSLPDAATASRTNNEENSSSAKPNLLDSNLSNEESKLSSSRFAEYSDTNGGGNAPRSSPLFRIEAADDDLGLTCQLGQVGPAATCPCATPRYKVIGASTTIPDDRSLASSSSTNHPEETDNNRPLQESSFYNSLPETNLSNSPPSSSSSTTSSSPTKQYRTTDHSSADDNSQARCPGGWAATQCQKLNSIMFFADEETGDVFLQNGYSLQPGRYYFITLQVSALPVNSSGYKPWREQIVATLYVKSLSSSHEPSETEKLFTGEFLDQTSQIDNGGPKSSSETQEVGTVDEVYDDEAFTKEETSGKYSSNEEKHEKGNGEAEIARKKKAEENARNGAASQGNSNVFNYHPLDDLEDSKKIDSIRKEIEGNGNQQQQQQQRQDEKLRSQQQGQHRRNGMWENVEESEQLSDDEDDSGAEQEEKKMTDKRTTTSVSTSSSSSHSVHPLPGKMPTNKENEQSGGDKKMNNGAHNVMIMSNVKNKLPYALRADRPHFKYPFNYPALDFVDSGDSAFDTMIPEDEFPAGRKKREVPEKSPYIMAISRVNSDGANTTAIPLGVLTKLRLEIQVASELKPKDFTLEIRTLRATETNIRFVILSAYVISIGSAISFDKGTTNLAPLMMPWNNSTVYESAIWKWKNVKCEGLQEQQPSFASSSSPSSPSLSIFSQYTTASTTKHPQRNNNNEILIEFEVVAINTNGGGSVINRWMSSGGNGISSTSAMPPRKQRKRVNPLNDKNLNDHQTSSGDGRSRDDDGGIGGGGNVHPLSPPHRGELNDNGIDDGTLKGSAFFPSVSVNPFRKATKQFHVTLVPVSAYISYPSGQGQRDEYLSNNNYLQEHDNGNVHETHSYSATIAPAFHAEKLVEKVMKIKKGIDKGDDGGDSTTPNRIVGDTESNTNKKKSDGDDNYYLNNRPNDGTTQSRATIMAHIMLPVKYSPGDNNRDISRAGNQPYETVDTSRKSVSKNINYKGFHDARNNAAPGVDVLLVGPTEIPQGGWVSYVMKVYLNHSCQFQLKLEPLQGNEIQYQDTVSVGDIRIVDIGKHFSSCSKIPKKGGFRVTCRKLNGRKGDYCTVESPIMRYCSTSSPSKNPNARVDETISSDPMQGNYNHTKVDAEEKWNKVVQKEQHAKRNEHSIEENGNMLQFEGIIYGFPGSAPGSQFALRAHVHVESIDDGNPSGRRSAGTTSSADVQVKTETDTRDAGGFSVVAEKTLSGKIVHRKQKIRGPLSADLSSLDFPDGKIPVMREFPAYHYRKRRNIFLEHMSRTKKNESSRTSANSISRNNTPGSSNDENANKRIPSKANMILLPQSPKSDNQKKSAEMKEPGIGTSAKMKAYPIVKLDRRRRSPSAAATANESRSPADANTGNLSSHPNLHGFTTWDSFVKITSRHPSGRKRKAKRSSTWSSLL